PVALPTGLDLEVVVGHVLLYPVAAVPPSVRARAPIARAAASRRAAPRSALPTEIPRGFARIRMLAPARKQYLCRAGPTPDPPVEPQRRRLEKWPPSDPSSVALLKPLLNASHAARCVACRGSVTTRCPSRSSANAPCQSC